MPEKINVPLDKLNDLVAKALTALGLSGEDLETVRDVLVYAELRGNTQGFDKILSGAVSPNPQATPMVVDHCSKVVTRIEGNRNVGMVVLQRAVDEAIVSARHCGIGVCGTRGTTSSTGAIGYFAERAAQQGFVCMIFGGTPKAVAPHGSVDPIFGTNPLAFAVPTDSEPMVLDMATSAVSWFGLVQSERRGETISDDLAFDPSGAPTTDPLAARKGAIRTFGGAKGSALALMIELLSGPLVGGAIAGDKVHSSGNLVLVLDADAFGQGETFRDDASRLLSRIKASRPALDSEGARLPGEQSTARLQRAEELGVFEMDRSIYDGIINIAEGKE